MQAVGIAGRQDDGAREHDHVFAGDDVEREHAADRAVGLAQQRRHGGLLEPRDLRLDDLLAAQVHERHAGIALHVRRDAADLARAGDDVALLVAPQVEPRLLQLRIVDVLDPLAAAPRPVLIDQELVVILDEELGGVARLLLGVAERAARQHQVAGEDRGAALADQSLADDDGLDARAMQVERRIAAGRPAPDDRHIGIQYLHRRLIERGR